MIFSEKQILKKCQYDVTCQITASGFKLSHPWGPAKEIIEESEELREPLAKLYLWNICQVNKYPYKYSFFEKNKNDKNDNMLETLIDDVLDNGVRPEHFALAKEANLDKPFLKLTEIYLQPNEHFTDLKLR